MKGLVCGQDDTCVAPKNKRDVSDDIFSSSTYDYKDDLTFNAVAVVPAGSRMPQGLPVCEGSGLREGHLPFPQEQARGKNLLRRES